MCARKRLGPGDPDWRPSNRHPLVVAERQRREIEEWAREEVYTRHLRKVMPQILEQDVKMVALVDMMLDKALVGGLEKEDLALLRALSPERRAIINRQYGETVKRERRESVHTHVDAAELVREGRKSVLDRAREGRVVESASDPAESESGVSGSVSDIVDVVGEVVEDVDGGA